MTKEQFIAIGLTEEQATKAAEESKKELEGFIPKSRFDEVNNAKKEAEKQVKERDTQLEEAKKNAGDNESLKKQLEDAQKANKEAQEKYETDLKEERTNNAIKLAINGKVHDDSMVAGLVDKTKIIVNDDGTVTGLEEQLKAIKESKAFLFKEEKAPEPKPGFFPKAPGEPKGGDPNHTPSIAEALAARFSQQ